MADPSPSGEKPIEPVASGAVAPVAAVSAPVEVKADPSPAVVEPKAAVEPVEKPVEAKVDDKPVVQSPETDDATKALLNAVPEKYEIPGVKDTGLIEAIAPVLKDAKVTLGQATKLAETFRAYAETSRKQGMASDLDALRADPELGKLNFGRTQQRVNDALAAFSTPDERSALTSLGIANNPTLVRMFHRIGAAMQEAPQTDAGTRPRGRVSTSTKLYGGRDRVASGPVAN